MSDQPMRPDPQTECGHECLKDDGHVERGEPHFYGYQLPSKSDLRAQLTQREAELAALREKVQGIYELVMLFDHEAVYDLKNDILAVLSGRWEGRDE
jgi:hypothetical protein